MHTYIARSYLPLSSPAEILGVPVFRNFFQVLMDVITFSTLIAGPGGRAVKDVGLRPHSGWVCSFESPIWHGFLCLVNMVCCHVEVSWIG